MSIASISGSDSPLSAITKNKDRQNLQGNSSLMASAASVDSASMTVPTAAADDPVKEFTDYMKMTPEQRMQAAWLKKHGITQEEFDAMGPAEKQKLMEQMRAEIEEEMKQKAEAKAKSPTTDILA